MVLVSSATSQPFCVALSPSVHWHARFLYCCALYNVFFLGFRQWRSRTDRVLTLNMNIRLPLFWSTWSPARGQDSATCAGLAHGRDYSNCRASELKLQKCLAIVFPWIVKNTVKQWPLVRVFQPSSTGLFPTLIQPQDWGFSNPHPQDCAENRLVVLDSRFWIHFLLISC